jgi:hypothetical protein
VRRGSPSAVAPIVSGSAAVMPVAPSVASVPFVAEIVIIGLGSIVFTTSPL